MSAGTEGYVDTRGSSTFIEDSIGTMISKVLAAKVLADKERKFAQKKALEQGIDEAQFNSMFPRGDFFKKALVGEFGGFKVKKKKQELAALYRKALLIGKVTKNKKLRGKVVGQLKQSLIYSKANLKNSKRFRSQFDYTDYESYFEPQSEKIPSTRKKTKNAIDGSGKRVSREQIIESIDAIAKSIERTAQAITQSSASVYGTLITSNQLQADVAQDLKVRNTTLEDKLQKLVDVISNQTQVQKNIVDKREDIQQEAQLERKTVAAGSETPDDLRTKENERKMYSSFADESDMMAAYGYGYEPPMVKPVSGMMNDLPSMEAYGYPKAEKGGMFSGKGGLELHGTEALLSPDGSAKIVSGPDSGYLYKIDKPTKVVPLNNNYTQEEPSAVTGKVEPLPKPPVINNAKAKPETPLLPKPKLQQFEMGTQNTFNNTNNVNALTMNNDLTQSLIDAASLLPMAAGGGTLAMTNEYLSTMGSSGDEVRPLIQQNSRALSNVFGLPSTITSKASGTKTVAKPKGEKEKTKEEDKIGKKSLFEKMKEGFGKFMELLGKKINDTDPNNGPGPGMTGPGVSGPGVDFSGNEKSVEVPVQQNVLNTFGSTQNWSVFRETLASKESGGKYNIKGGSGGAYEGRYQINNAYLGAIANMLGEKAPTREQFRNDPAMQERFMQAYTMDNHRQLMALSPKYKKMSKEEQMSILGYAHNQGAGAAADWVEKGMGAGGKDGFGTAGRWYYENVKANLSKYAEKPKTPTPTTPVASNKRNRPGGGTTALERADTSRALTSEEKKVADAARKEADAMGLTGKDKAEYVAQKVEAVMSPIFQRPSQDKPSSIYDMSSAPSSNKPMIVALNTPATTQTSTAGTATPPNAETETVGKGSNPLKGSGLYIG